MLDQVREKKTWANRIIIQIKKSNCSLNITIKDYLSRLNVQY